MTLITHEIKDEISTSNLISFDIFDTLILRPYVRPSDMFTHIERLYGIKNFAKKRVAAENKARSLSTDDEISFDDIYEVMGGNFASAKKIELEFEKTICQPNPEMLMVYNHAREVGKRIVFVSDMYLPEKTIIEILNLAGYTEYEALYLSSTHKKRKANGALFEVLLEKTGVSPGDVLHIGDNKNNDYEQAVAKKINAILYPKVIDRFMQENGKMESLFRDNYDNRFHKDKLTFSILLGINALVWVENLKDNYWTRFGSLYAGPFLYFFTKWLYNNARQNKINNIALVARDGFNLIKIFKTFDKRHEFNAHYVYLPRHVSESANINSPTDLEHFLKELGKTYETLLDFITEFSKEDVILKERWEDFKLHHKTLSHKDLKQFVIENQPKIIEISQNKKETVYQYLNNLDLFSGDLMVVDSSCTKARPQLLLKSIISEFDLNVPLLGYYYKVNRPNNNLIQNELRPEIDRKYQTDNWDMMEFFMSSPEKPIISIEKNGEGYHPVYKNIEDSDYEKYRIKASEMLSQGVMKFTEKAFSIFKDKEIIKDLDSIVAYVNNIINNPSLKDVNHIKNLHHSVNNDNEYTPLILKDNHLHKDLKQIHAQRVEVKRMSPDLENYFIGGSLSQIMNDNENEHLAINVPFIDRLPTGKDEASICVIDEDGAVEKIGDIFQWNFQLGALVQFRPKYNDDIIFNTISKNQKKYFGQKYNLKTRHSTHFKLPVLNVSANGKLALSVDVLKPFDIKNPWKHGTFKKEQINKQQGYICVMDLDTAEVKNILSLGTLLGKITDQTKKADFSACWINKLSFNPDNSRILLQLGIKDGEMAGNSYTFTCDINGENIYFMPHMISNIAWKNSKSLFVSSSNISGRSEQKYETLYELDDQSSDFRVIDKAFFTKKGNICYHPDGRYVLYDAESDTGIPYRKLQLYDLDAKKGINLGLFYAEPQLFNGIKALRCEFRPRWSQGGKYITFDSIHEGFRGIYQISAEEAIAEIYRDLETISEHEIKKILTPNSPQISENILTRVAIKVKQKIKGPLKYIIRGRVRNYIKKIYYKAGLLYFAFIYDSEHNYEYLWQMS